MITKKQFFGKLMLLMTISIWGNTLFAQNDFAFRLVKPSSNEQIIMKMSDKLPVEITFNADAVNDIGAYIATFRDGNFARFSVATTMTSPFQTYIDASHFSAGKHLVEYILLPSGIKDPAKALEKIAINIEVEESTFKTDVDIKNFIQDIIVEIIRKNDIETFKSYCIDEKTMNGIVNSIKESSPKEKAVKKELSSMNIEAARKKMISNFSEFQQKISENKADRTTAQFKGLLSKNDMDMSNFNAMSRRFGIEVSGKSYTISIKAFVTKSKIYMFGFKYNIGFN